jgi:hypothetical protein
MAFLCRLQEFAADLDWSVKTSRRLLHMWQVKPIKDFCLDVKSKGIHYLLIDLKGALKVERQTLRV